MSVITIILYLVWHSELKWSILNSQVWLWDVICWRRERESARDIYEKLWSSPWWIKLDSVSSEDRCWVYLYFILFFFPFLPTLACCSTLFSLVMAVLTSPSCPVFHFKGAVLRVYATFFVLGCCQNDATGIFTLAGLFDTRLWRQIQPYAFRVELILRMSRLEAIYVYSSIVHRQIVVFVFFLDVCSTLCLYIWWNVPPCNKNLFSFFFFSSNM